MHGFFLKVVDHKKRETRRTINSRLDVLWNPPRLNPPKFEAIKKSDLEAYDYIVIDTDSPPEDTVAMIRNNLPHIILIPINTSQKRSLKDIPVFLDTAADIEKKANLEPGLNYNPKFIVVPLGIREVDAISKINEAKEKPKFCQVAPAMANLQEQINNALEENRYIWDYPDCEETLDYFINLLNLLI